MNKKMKKSVIFLLVFMLLCNSVLIGHNAQTVRAENEITSIITNGNFESGSVMTEAITSQGSSVAYSGAIGDSGWSWYTGVAGASFQVINESQESNNKVMKMSHSSDSGGSGTIMYNYTPALTNGATYKITVKVKAENISGSSLYFTLGGQKIDAAKLLANACGDTWYTHTFNYTLSSADTKSRLEIAAYGMKAGGNWLIDDVSIEPVVAEITSINLNKEELELTVGSEEILIATVIPENATDKTVSWTSSDSTVATVDENGKVKAIAEGNTIITATISMDNMLSDTCTVIVKKVDSGQENTNMIVNGDFQAGSVMEQAEVSQGSDVKSRGDIGDSEWDWYTGVAGACFQVIGEPGDLQNNKVMKMSHSATEGGSGTLIGSCIPSLEVGATYSITVKVKAEGMTGKYLSFKLGGNSVNAASLSGTNCSSDSWYTLTFEYELTSKTKDTLEIVSYGMPSGAYWLIDDISITKVVSDESTTVTEIILNKTELTLVVGDEETLSATVVPENATDKTISWTSSDNAVVSVDVNGKVTAKAVGTATITATTTNGKNVTCIVTVTEAQFGEPEATPIIKNGDFEKISNVSVVAKTVGNGGTAGTVPIGTTDWSYYMASSYTVNMQYDIIAAGRGGSGNAMKIYSAAGQADTTAGRGVVRQDNIALPELESGATYKLIVYAKPSTDIDSSSYLQVRWVQGGTKKESAINKAVQLDAEDWSVYTINLNKDTAAAVANGIQIYAYNMKTGYWLIDDISIKKVPVITMDKAQINLEVGDFTEISASITDDDMVLGVNPVLTYSSDDTTIATVSEDNGMFTINAVGIGETVITVKSADESVYAECVVKVAPKKIIMNGDFAAGLDNNWTTGTTTDVTYTSIAEGRTDNALKVAVSDGVTGAVSGNFEQLLDAKVTEGLVANGSKYLVTVYAKPVGANSDSVVNVSWHDSESATAKTSEIQAGTSTEWIPVTFEFTAGDVSIAGTNLEVQVSNLTSGYWLFDDISIKRIPYVSLTPAEMNFVVGERAEIDATMIDPDYILDKSGAFDYISADESIAKVDLRGRVTGVSVGTTTITVTSAYYPEYSATLDVTVSAIDLTAISLPESLNLCVAEQEELSVTVTPANTTNQTISWNSSDVNVAVVDENGLVTGINAGTATITATGANNLTASCTVTVRESTTLLTEEAKITSTTYQEVAGGFGESVTNNTDAKASYSLYEAPENGVLTVNEDGSFFYIPRNGQVGDRKNFTVIVKAGIEYAFIKGNIEVVETIDDGNNE